MARTTTRATRGDGADVVDVKEVAKVLSHVIHAKAMEPEYVILKLGLSMSNVTDGKKVKAEASAAKSIAWVVERRRGGEGVVGCVLGRRECGCRASVVSNGNPGGRHGEVVTRAVF